MNKLQHLLHQTVGLLQQLADLLYIIIGKIFQWVLLPAVFILCLVPYGLLARRGKRDILQRYFEKNKTSYWQDVSEKPQRKKQF